MEMWRGMFRSTVQYRTALSKKQSERLESLWAVAGAIRRSPRTIAYQGWSCIWLVPGCPRETWL